MSDYTPGPWEWATSGLQEGDLVAGPVDPDHPKKRRPIVVSLNMDPYGGGCYCNDADARLIAAAPEMAEILTDLDTFGRMDPVTLKFVREVLARIRGEAEVSA